MISQDQRGSLCLNFGFQHLVVTVLVKLLQQFVVRFWLDFPLSYLQHLNFATQINRLRIQLNRTFFAGIAAGAFFNTGQLNASVFKINIEKSGNGNQPGKNGQPDPLFFRYINSDFHRFQFKRGKYTEIVEVCK